MACLSLHRFQMPEAQAFGTLAIDSDKGESQGFSDHDDSSSEARDRALRECHRRGGCSCVVRVWGSDTKS